MKELENKEDLMNYQKHYSESKFWDKLKKVVNKLGKESARKILELYYVMTSPYVSLKDKAIIVGALGYFILPFDLIPDVIIGLGFTDDIAAITLAYNAVASSITPEIKEKTNMKLAEWFD